PATRKGGSEAAAERVSYKLTSPIDFINNSPKRGSPLVDRSALKTNQAGIVLTLLVAFLLGAFWPATAILIPVLAAILLVGTFLPNAALFKQVYARVLRPAGLVRAQPVAESPKPHNFAQLLGGIFLALASLAFLL